MSHGVWSPAGEGHEENSPFTCETFGSDKLTH